MKLAISNQKAPISSEVLARIAVIRPILEALLYGINKNVTEELGGTENIKLFMLPRAYREGNGDIGFCFEWAIHDAIQRQESSVIERLEDAGKQCKLHGKTFSPYYLG